MTRVIGQSPKGRVLHLMGELLDERYPPGHILHELYKGWGYLGWSVCGEHLGKLVSGATEPTCKDCLAKMAPKVSAGMSADQVASVCMLYQGFLAFAEDKESAHVRTMLNKIPKFMEDGREDKAMRWLGFIQGWLWARGFYTIEQMADHNRG